MISLSILPHDVQSKVNFLFLTDFNKLYSTSAVFMTELFVFRAVPDNLRTCRDLLLLYLNVKVY